MDKQEFTTFKRRLWHKTLLVIVVASIAGVFVRALLLGVIGDQLIAWVQYFAPVDDASAFHTYRSLLQKNQMLLFVVALMVVGYVLYRVLAKEVVARLNHILQSLKTVTADNNVLETPYLPEVTQQIQALQQTIAQKELFAKEAEQRKDDLVVYLAHDIRTPLTTIIGYLTLLEESPQLTVEQREHYTRLILARAYKLEGLTNELFDIARFNLQEIPLHKNNLNVTFLLEQLVEEFNYLGEERQVRVVLQESYPPIMLVADAVQLARAMGNILKNAIQHSYTNSTIEVGVLQKEESVWIEITNEGSTIPPQIQAQIFDKFYRADYSRSSQSGGAGLGLAIAAEIIQLHEGAIYVKSESGLTTFTLQLPFLRET